MLQELAIDAASVFELQRAGSSSLSPPPAHHNPTEVVHTDQECSADGLPVQAELTSSLTNQPKGVRHVSINQVLEQANQLMSKCDDYSHDQDLQVGEHALPEEKPELKIVADEIFQIERFLKGLPSRRVSRGQPDGECKPC